MSNFVIIERRSLELVGAGSTARSSYTLEDAAHLADVHPELVRYYWRVGLFGRVPGEGEPEPTFDDDSLYELRRIEHYRRHFGVNRRALPVISRLLREVARLETEVRSRDTA